MLFFGIFLTMMPTLELLRTRGSELGVREPWQFFWATGILSSFLDNAPTYLTFFKLAQGLGLEGVHGEEQARESGHAQIGRQAPRQPAQEQRPERVPEPEQQLFVLLWVPGTGERELQAERLRAELHGATERRRCREQLRALG